MSIFDVKIDHNATEKYDTTKAALKGKFLGFRENKQYKKISD